MRIILYTGKGGVGKTSIAAATALRAADMGHSTLVMSTDVAHSLADSFDMELEAEPTPITENLWGQEIDVLKEMQTHWSIVQDWLAALMQWQGMDEVVADEVAVLPGMEEMVGLLNITHHYDSGQFDTIIVDCAPTGETLRLLSFPEMARWYMRKLFPIERRVATALGPMARGLFNLPVPDPKVFDSIQDLFHRLERMRSILGDPEQSSVRLVMNPEKMVIRGDPAHLYVSEPVRLLHGPHSVQPPVTGFRRGRFLQDVEGLSVQILPPHRRGLCTSANPRIVSPGSGGGWPGTLKGDWSVPV